MFSSYFVFHCLNMLYFEKQVLGLLATHFGYLRELPVLATKPQVHTEWFRDSARDLPVAKHPESAF